MKSLFWTFTLIVGMVMAPAIAAGQAQQSSSANFPISQPLVREGTFAVSLAVALKLGAVTDEAEAESLLSSAGIMPRNGWIADYPVTPDIIGELGDSVAQASASGGVKMGTDDAVYAFQGVVDKYGLAVTGDYNQTEPADVSSAPACSAGEDVNTYYNEEGPPVVTYCAPPAAYDYLYSWVPYPFWWSDFWFPGFFVLVDFDRTVVAHHHRHHFSNHFFDRKHGRFERVDAANRLHWGTGAGRTASGGAAAVHRTQAVTKGMNAITTSRSGFVGRQTANTPTQFQATPGSVPQHSSTVTPAPSTGRMGSFRSGGGGGTPAAPNWQGGHSFGGFSGSSGGRFGR